MVDGAGVISAYAVSFPPPVIYPPDKTFRIDADSSIPQYHESVPLRTALRVLGWTGGVLGILGGFLLAGITDSELAEVAGSLLVVAGGSAVYLTAKCSSYEVTVGTSRLDLWSGPFRRMAPSGAVLSVSRRPASSWRRLFADDELWLRIEERPDEMPVPSRRPEELIAALEAGGGDDRGS